MLHCSLQPWPPSWRPKESKLKWKKTTWMWHRLAPSPAQTSLRNMKLTASSMKREFTCSLRSFQSFGPGRRTRSLADVASSVVSTFEFPNFAGHTRAIAIASTLCFKVATAQRHPVRPCGAGGPERLGGNDEQCFLCGFFLVALLTVCPIIFLSFLFLRICITSQPPSRTISRSGPQMGTLRVFKCFQR